MNKYLKWLKDKIWGYGELKESINVIVDKPVIEPPKTVKPVTASVIYKPVILPDPARTRLADMSGNQRRRALVEGLPAFSDAQANDYIVYKDGNEVLSVEGSSGKARYGDVSGTVVIQNSINSITSGGSVLVKAGTYGATPVTVIDGVRLVIDRGATDITYSINSGASCVIQDYHNNTEKIYEDGTLVSEENVYPEELYSYIVWVDGGTYYAKNGHTGAIQFSGTDASTVIQNALNTLTAGGKILLKNGIYTLFAPLNLLGLNSITISGETHHYNMNNGTWLYLANNVNDAVIKKVEGGTTYGYIIIEDLGINGNKAAQATGHGILIENTLYVKIINVKILNAKEDGINSNDGDEFWVEDSEIASSGKSGIKRTGAHTIITGNIIYQNGEHGIWLYGDKYANRIENNDIYLNQKSGVYLYGSLKETYIEANSIHTNNQIAAWNAEMLISSSGGVSISDTTIFGNFINNGFYGIIINDAGTATINTKIIGNCFDTTTDYAITTQGNTIYTTIEHNNFVAVGAYLSLVDTVSYISHNVGFVTENSGTATITAAATSIVVSHGCSYTPSALDVSVILTNLPTNDIGDVYVDTFGAVNMTIHCRNVPGVSTAIFNWNIQRTP